MTVSTKDLVDKLREEHSLTKDEYRCLLTCDDRRQTEYLHETARAVACKRFGNKVFVRGLVEFSNVCKNNCLYCGIRQANKDVRRYAMSSEEVIATCRSGYEQGFRTFVLQSGDAGDGRDEWLAALVAELHRLFPDCAITLSVGEKRRETYEKFFANGATRYLLRHETYDEEHYSRLHPDGMTIGSRLECLHWLKEIGFQTGTGIMVGSPFQTVENIIDDIVFIHDFHPEMIGLGPFVPHHATPFAQCEAGSADLTLRLYSVFRLMFPDALIPATTALQTLSADGHQKGILAGANVIMPNLTPRRYRADYSLYDDKASYGSEAAEGIERLKSELSAIGYEIDFAKGDYETKQII